MRILIYMMFTLSISAHAFDQNQIDNDLKFLEQNLHKSVKKHTTSKNDKVVFTKSDNSSFEDLSGKYFDQVKTSNAAIKKDSKVKRRERR